MDDQMVTFRQARQLTGLSGATLRRWTREGRLPDRRSAGGQRVFVLSELGAAAGAPLRSRHEPSGSTVVAYARVSSRRQAAEGDLERQIERLRGWAETERPGSELLVFSDVGSGLSDNRSGLRRVLARVQRDDVSEIVVTHRERLARFGTKSMELLLSGFGVKVTAIGEDEDLSLSQESELVRDMLAIVTSFSGRLYGQRSAKARAIAACVKKGTTAAE
ncbi:MAG: IS607 family transposase [Acidimicrobiales bacterium]|jgi:predicted site-specific integrase-resolvase